MGVAAGEDDEVLTINAAAEVLAVSESTLRRWDQAGNPG
jgi:DNA-binding transcriptional regulator YiaG